MVPSACSYTCFIMMKMLQSAELPEWPSMAITLPCCLSGFISESRWAWKHRRCWVMHASLFGLQMWMSVRQTRTPASPTSAVWTQSELSCARGRFLVQVASNWAMENAKVGISFFYSHFHTVSLTLALSTTSQNWVMESVKVIRFHFLVFPPWSNTNEITELNFQIIAAISSLHFSMQMTVHL